jgi:Helix-turn-helix domain/RodZ C-terminal domain
VFEIGNSLREARLRQGLEIPRIEADTKIRGKYLRALEEEHFDVLPGDTYVKGFLKTYADYLGLDGQLYLDEFNSRFAAAEEISVTQSPPTRRKRRRVEANLVVVALAGIVAVTVLVVVGLAGIGTGSDDPPFTGTSQQSTTNDSGVPTTGSDEKPRKRAKLVLTAARGDSFLQVRNYGVNGKLLWEGTLEEGQVQRFVRSRRLWLDLDEPQNLNAKLNGRRVELPSEPAVLLVTPSEVRILSTGE